MPFVDITNQSIFYAARGLSGAPLVFIHGAGDSHLCWNGQLAAFGAHRANQFAPTQTPSVPADTGTVSAARAFALDLPGHGRSGGAGRTTVHDYAVAVREFLDVLNLERAVIVGISMGGAIAQTLAVDFPERVLGLGLVGTGAKLRVAPAFLQGIQSDFENIARVLVENFFTPDAPRELKEKGVTQLLATGAQVTYDDFAACDAFDLRARLGEIRARTLIVCGSEDKMTPPKYSEYLAQNIAGAQYHRIENAGHMTMLEQPAAFNAILGAWLGRLN
ncbi:MAG: alpha/beta fold hydrolase [Chloroflexi bacterium]|nr:alpha/beta fold hydrolase [Chloroflexota bacterium]